MGSKKKWQGLPKKTTSYSGRNALLKRAGFTSYRAYLASPLWTAIRTRVLARDRGLCKLCAGPAAQAHHRYYSRSNLKGSNLSGLVALCRNCHEAVELDGSGKRTLAESEAAYRRLEGDFARAK